MTNNRLFNHCLICAFILVTGFGLALVIPWFARFESLASEDFVKNQVNLPSAERYYVAKSGDGTTGLEWTKAFTDVQNALGVAKSSDEIWVATGVYTPGANQTDSFNLVPGIGIYGGFDGTETSRSQQDWVANPTILSGDIEGDDINTDGVVKSTSDIVGNNNRHVVFADGTTGTPILSNTVIDGFTITAGNASDGSDPVYDIRGGGFFCDGSYNNNECSPSLKNIKFAGNFATHFGGALYNYGYDKGTSAPILTNVIFTGNYAADKGGAMYNEGGAGKSSPTLTNVSFAGNSAQYKGGAMYNNGRGGVSNPTLTNVTFSGNSAALGGAIYNDGYLGVNAPQIHNSILWNNMDNSGTGTISTTVFNYTASVTITHSLVQGAMPGGSWIGGSYINGGGNLDESPLFVLDVNPSDAPTTTGNLRLQTGSPAVDTGDNQLFIGIPRDLDGNPRIVDGDLDGTLTIDMGAYEFQINYPHDIFVPLIFQ